MTKEQYNNLTIDTIIRCNDSILNEEMDDLYENVLYDVCFNEYYEEEPTIEELKKIEEEAR